MSCFEGAWVGLLRQFGGSSGGLPRPQLSAHSFQHCLQPQWACDHGPTRSPICRAQQQHLSGQSTCVQLAHRCRIVCVGNDESSLCHILHLMNAGNLIAAGLKQRSFQQDLLSR